MTNILVIFIYFCGIFRPFFVVPIMSSFWISLIIATLIANIASEILWCETDFRDISDWITDGGLKSSNRNNCLNNGYNECGHLDPNNGNYTERISDASRYIALKITFKAFLDGRLENGEGFYVDYRCRGNWNILYSFTNTTDSDIIFNDTELLLPIERNLYSNVWIRFRFIADNEDMYFNDVCLTGELTSSPTNIPSVSPTIDPTMNPSISPSIIPTEIPSNIPTETPSDIPTIIPTIYPSTTPTDIPSITPVIDPSISPTNNPSILPTIIPTFSTPNPTSIPTIFSTSNPTKYPSLIPSNSPSNNIDSSQKQSFSNSFWIIIIGFIDIFCVTLVLFLLRICMRYYATKKKLMSKENK